MHTGRPNKCLWHIPETLLLTPRDKGRADFCSSLRSPVYPQRYLRYYPAAEPVEEFDDRNRLYSLKGTINYSAGHPGCIVRQT